MTNLFDIIEIIFSLCDYDGLQGDYESDSCLTAKYD